ncbi:hypothetical protein DENIT_10681 [Pseudomonas veronii]|nr:hypothetical protein DENIT_10681 [Pseudomonas veronii]
MGSHFITDALGQLPLTPSCRSELAREKTKGTAFIQDVRFIVAVFREQARSYRRSKLWLF